MNVLLAVLREFSNMYLVDIIIMSDINNNFN